MSDSALQILCLSRITDGGEPATLLESSRADGLFARIFDARALAYPNRLAFSVTIGFEPSAGNGDFLKQTGAKALEELPSGSPGLIFAGLKSQTSELINPVASLLWHGTDLWNGNRLRILARLLEGRKEREIARTLEISERAVYKNVTEGRLRDWIALAGIVEDRLNSILS